MASTFERLSTETQGRVKPAHAAPLLGNYVFVLGSDVPGDVQRFSVGDQVVLEQTADVTGLKLIRFRARVRGPVSVPTTGYDLDVIGSVPLVPVTVRWLFQWGVGADVHGTRELLPGRTIVVNDGAIDVSQLAGNQALRFVLKLSS